MDYGPIHLVLERYFRFGTNSGGLPGYRYPFDIEDDYDAEAMAVVFMGDN